MSELDEIRVFVQLVESGSATRAAARLNVAISAVSRRMKDLEARLGVQLLQRTTRRMHLTEQGNFYYERCRRLLDELEETEQLVRNNARTLSGTIRVAAPVSFGVAHLAPAVAEFMFQNPEIIVDIKMSDRRIDLIDEGIDVGIRIGQLEDSSLQARKLSCSRHVVCASPDFLKRHGSPEHPADLATLPALCYSNAPRPNQWRYFDTNGEPGAIDVATTLTIDNGDALREAATMGLGIICEPSFIVHSAVKYGSLVPVLTEYTWKAMDIYAVYAQTRFVAARVRAFIEFMAARFTEPPYWEQSINQKS